MRNEAKIIAHLPTAVELSKWGSKNELKLHVKIADFKEGSLYLSRGRIEWWPNHNSVNAYTANWKKLIEVLEANLSRRRSKRSRRKK